VFPPFDAQRRSGRAALCDQLSDLRSADFQENRKTFSIPPRRRLLALLATT
jgi:hypothetical protein